MSEMFEPVDFTDVREGDRVQFVTTAYGSQYWRTGVVTKVTARTVAVQCGDDTTAVLRGADWGSRAVDKATGH